MAPLPASDPVRPVPAPVALLLCLSLAACGSGGDDTESTASTPSLGAAAGAPGATECAPSALPAPDTGTVACAAFDDAARARALDLVNAARAEARSCGAEAFAAAPALVWNPCLEAAAAGHSTDMATHNFVSHTGSDGGELDDRVNASGFRWVTIGENIAVGQTSAAEAMSGWLESPGHCENLMNPGFASLGMSCRFDAGTDYGSHWTQVFGRSR